MTSSTCPGAMSTESETLLQCHFPSLEVTVISDVFNQCDPDMHSTVEHLRTLFPDAYVAKICGQTTDQEPLQEPWSPPTQSPVTSPRRFLRSTESSPTAPKALDPDFMQRMFPSPTSTRPKQAEPDGRNTVTKLLTKSTSRPRTNEVQKRDVQNAKNGLDGHDNRLDRGKRQVPQPVHAYMPFLQNLLPREQPPPKATRSCKSIGGDSTDLSPGTPPGLHDVQASAADWDLILNHSRPASRRTSGTSTLAGTSKTKGMEGTAMGKPGPPETLVQLTDRRSSSTRSSSPDRDPASTAPLMPGGEGAQEYEAFLREMFPTIDVDLVRDVLHNVQGNSEKACHQLLVIQNVADYGEAADPSCPSSEDGYASASLDGAGSRGGDGGSADGGCVWDMFGVPVDYTFKHLTDEQKVAMIRKELPRCSAEEAHNALEACLKDVNFAIASLSQVYDKDDRHVPATSHANLTKEVTELQKTFPSADPEALINALSVSDNSVAVAKATLRANGMNPIAKPRRIEPRLRSPPQKPPSGLFSPPQPADVRQAPLDVRLPNGSFQPPLQARLWRRNHVDNQKLYDDHRSLAFEYKAEMDRAFKDGNRAKARGDWALASKYKTDFEQAKVNYGAAQAEAAKAIYKAKNSNLNDIPMQLDLHGLHVHEAVAQLRKTIEEWRDTPEGIRTAIKRLDVITGKGLHSVDNVARILQAVIQYVEEEGMSYYQKPGKDGVMIHLADTGQASFGNCSAVWNGYG